MEFSGQVSCSRIDSIFDLLHFIENQAQSGCLSLEKLPFREEFFHLYFNRGHLVNLTHNIYLLNSLSEIFKKEPQNLEEVIISVLHYISLFWEEIFFHFDPGVSGFEFLSEVSISKVLLKFLAERDELYNFLQTLLRRRIKFRPSGEFKERQFSSLELWIYGEAIRHSSVEKIIFGNIPFKEVVKGLVKLVHSGLLEPYEEKLEKAEEKRSIDIEERFLPSEAIFELRKFLQEMIGPAGDLIISEVLEEMGISENNFPKEKKGEFLQKIITKIPEGCFYRGEACDQLIIEKFEEILKQILSKSK